MRKSPEHYRGASVRALSGGERRSLVDCECPPGSSLWRGRWQVRDMAAETQTARARAGGQACLEPAGGLLQAPGKQRSSTGLDGIVARALDRAFPRGVEAAACTVLGGDLLDSYETVGVG